VAYRYSSQEVDGLPPQIFYKFGDYSGEKVRISMRANNQCKPRLPQIVESKTPLRIGKLLDFNVIGVFACDFLAKLLLNAF
jgi:hypothetical protein